MYKTQDEGEPHSNVKESNVSQRVSPSGPSPQPVTTSVNYHSAFTPINTQSQPDATPVINGARSLQLENDVETDDDDIVTCPSLRRHKRTHSDGLSITGKCSLMTDAVVEEYVPRKQFVERQPSKQTIDDDNPKLFKASMLAPAKRTWRKAAEPSER